MIPEFDKTDLQRFKQELSTPRRITLLGHIAPDGDAVGSTVGFALLLNKMGHETRIVYPTRFTDAFYDVDGVRSTIIALDQPEEAVQAIQWADVLLCMDFNEPNRINRLADYVLKSDAFKVLIDHHLHPADFTDITFSFPKVSSTCLLTYHFIHALEWDDHIDRRVGEALYLGMMTDTGGFSFNSEDPSIYSAISHLLEKGIRKDTITSFVFRGYTLDKIRLNAHAVLNNIHVFDQYHTTIMTLTNEEKERFNYKVGDTEGLVNIPLEAKEIVFSIFIYETRDQTKISFRSKGDFPVNVFSRTYFNGGGHLNAAGAESDKPIEAVYDEVVRALEEMHPTEIPQAPKLD